MPQQDIPLPKDEAARPATWQDLIRAEATAAQVPPALALAVAEHESGFDPTRRGPIDEVGLMQLRPGTAQLLGVNPHDPIQNIRGGIRYLKQQLDATGGDVSAALSAYNAGPGGAPQPQYVQSVLSRLPKYLPQAQSTPVAAATPPTVAASMAGTPPPQPRLALGHTAAPPYPRLVSAKTGARITTQADQPGAPPAPVAGLRAAASDIFTGYDPRTPIGQRNWAGTAAGLGAAALTGGASLPVQIGAGMLAAGTAGALTTGAQQVAQGVSPTDVDLSSMALGGGEQAALEGMGQIVSWPFKAFGRRALAPEVSTYASKALLAKREAQEATLDRALRAAEDAVRASKQAAVQGEARVRGHLNMAAPATGPKQAGELVSDVLTGPAKTAKDQLGQAVTTAARTGPAIPTEKLQARLQDLSAQITPLASHEATTVEEKAAQLMKANPGMSQKDATGLITRNPTLDVGPMLPPDHPLPRVLTATQEALSAPTIPFEDAHKIKRLLDDAVNWDSPAKKQVQQITKGFRQTLRSEMAAAGHAPYEQATAAYTEAAKLHAKGIAPAFQKTALENPERLVKLIKGDEPTKLQMLHDLLTTQAAAGGGEAAGKTAWDAVRATWTHQNLVKGGPEKLLDRIDKLDPDFAKLMYGDQQGSLMLDNLKQIGQAFQEAQARGAEGIERAKAARVEAQRARQDVRAPTPEEQRFRESSIHKAPPIESTAADVLRATALGPTSIWGGLSIVRLMHGPKAADLIYWSAQSPLRTRLLVKAVTSPLPGLALSDFVRATGLVDKDVVEPPPAPRMLSSHPR